jgi:hypothetical protein
MARSSQYGQWVAQIGHLGQRLAEKIGARTGLGHRQNSQKSGCSALILGGLARPWCPGKPTAHAGARIFAGPTIYPETERCNDSIFIIGIHGPSKSEQ